MKLSKFTVFLSVYIIISSSFMQQVWNAWKVMFGTKRLILFFILLCLVTVSAILYKNLKSGINIKRMFLICVICILGFIFALRQPYLPEKAHVLEFGILGWLTLRDLTKQDKNFLKAVLKGLLFVTIIGFLEEGFQKFLPWRRFETRDIITDVLSGVLGIILYLLSQTRLSSFIRPL